MQPLRSVHEQSRLLRDRPRRRAARAADGRPSLRHPQSIRRGLRRCWPRPGCRVVRAVPARLRRYPLPRAIRCPARASRPRLVGATLLALLDAFGRPRARCWFGYDWGGARRLRRGSALARVAAAGLVSVISYNHPGHREGDAPRSGPRTSTGLWYQYYFHSERGRAGAGSRPRAASRALPAPLAADLVLRRSHPRAQRRCLRPP